MDEQDQYLNLSTGAVRGAASLDLGRMDVFLPLGGGRGPVLYQSHLGSSSQAHLGRLRKNGVTHVLVRAADLARCESALASQLEKILISEALTSQDKAEVIQGAGRSVAKELLGNGATSEGVDRMFSLVDQVGSAVLADPTIAAHLVNMAAYERSTASHMQIVATLAMILGAEIYGPDKAVLQQLAVGGMLHDIGKLSIPTTILQKESSLTRDEVLLIQQHPIESVRLIGANGRISPRVRQMILQHHERIDGRGYPLGLREASIGREARLLAIVDSFHAVVGPRAYRPPLTIEAANRVLLMQAGRQFDRELLECWVELCERQAETPKFIPATASPCPHEERFTKQERSSTEGARPCSKRRTRYRCEGRSAACIYAGRLHDVTAAPTAFNAVVIDISRGGLCLQVDHPMFRGEILNVHLPTEPRETWLQSMVAWCRDDGQGRYRIGLRLVRRISKQEARRRVECVRLGGMAAEAFESLASGEGGAGAVSLDAPPPPTAVLVLERLDAIARTNPPTAADERFVVRMIDADDDTVRVRAVEALARFESELAAQTLCALLGDAARPVRFAALACVERRRLEAALASLRDLLEHGDEEYALAVAGTLGALGDWSGMQRTASCLEEEGPLLEAAVRAFGKIIGRTFSDDADGARAARQCLAEQREHLSRQAEAVAAAQPSPV